MKKYYLLFLIVLVVFLSAAASAKHENRNAAYTENMNATMLKELIIDSEKNIETYRFTINQDQYTSIINLTDGNSTYKNRLQSLGAGGINLTSMSMKISTANLNMPAGHEENATAVATNVYLFNDTVYSSINSTWTSVKLPLPGNIWMSANRLQQSSKLINSSQVRLLGVAVVDGQGFYLVEVTPNSGALSSAVSQQLGSNPSLYPSNLSALLNNTSLRYVIWIEADNHLPILEYVQMNMVATPEMFGLPGPMNSEMRIDSSATVRFSGFNKTMSIVLPEEAKTAKLSALSSNQTKLTTLAVPQDPDPKYSSSEIASSPELQQQIWMAMAYDFLNGGYYPSYGSYGSFYSYPYMPYSPSYTPNYNPYYTPSYTPYSYYSPSYTPSVGYTTPAYTTPAQGYATSTQGYTVMTSYNSSFGNYLTDGKGMTLYHLANDGGNYNSICTDATCTSIWPPLYAQSINAPSSLNPLDFRSIAVNGYKQYQQTTYKGWPLYYYVGDTKPGDIKGHYLKDSYGTWSVVIPASPNTFPTNFPYSTSGATSTQYQSPTGQPYTTAYTATPSTATMLPNPSAYNSPSLYPATPTPRQVTNPVSGNVPTTISYPGGGPFDVYFDGNYIGTGIGGSFSFNAPAGYHDVRVWDGNFPYEQTVLFENGIPKIINVQAV